jgi:hypothetical protein
MKWDSILKQHVFKKVNVPFALKASYRTQQGTASLSSTHE